MPETFTAPEDAGRLDRWLTGQLPQSRNRIQSLIKSGSIRVNDATVRPSLKLVGGEVVTVEIPPPPPSTLEAQDIPIEILYEDEYLMVVVKPAGMVVHPSRGHPDGTLVNALLHRIRASGQSPGDPARPGIVHRLDKGTSGVLVVTRTDLTHAGLGAQFAAHTVHRRYLALVWGRPDPTHGTIDASLGRDPKDRLRFAVVPPGSGKRSVTHYRSLATSRPPGTGRGGEVSLIECRLETGRTHQIRVHLTHIGHPLLGDPVYASKQKRPSAWKPLLVGLDHQLLHAAQLGFTHPITGAEVRCDRAPPPDFQAMLARVGIPLSSES
ncbi:MAG: 23S rRNA pseudouridine1911/1915/1917 synthase [Myxococcota bacterium]|jgi:23S rRNA pseudouridine1911/1915/1917 synthase